MSQTGQHESVESNWFGRKKPELVKPLFRVHSSVFLVWSVGMGFGTWISGGVFGTCLALAAVAACVALAIGGRDYGTVNVAPFFCLLSTLTFVATNGGMALFIAGLTGSVAAHVIASHRVEATLRQYEEAAANDHE
ncbi:MAG: hypothetical protein GY851_25040 [bacterium]|nr:hypothetical protein [bacterium]